MTGDATLRKVGQLRKIAELMDHRFKVPGVGVSVGLDAILGLVPGVGDAVVTLPSMYIIGSAAQLGVRKRTLLRMAGNTGIDFLIGLVPLVGDFLDIGYRANLKNVRLLEAELGIEHASDRGEVTSGAPREVASEVVSP